jgi:hypothetical protein
LLLKNFQKITIQYKRAFAVITPRSPIIGQVS